MKATTCFLIFPTMMPQIFSKFLTRLEMKFGEVIIRKREWMIPTSSIHLMLIQSLGLFEVEMRTGFQFIHMKIFNPFPVYILRFWAKTMPCLKKRKIGWGYQISTHRRGIVLNTAFQNTIILLANLAFP